MGCHPDSFPNPAKNQNGEQIQPESNQQISEDFVENNDEVNPEEYSSFLVDQKLKNPENI
jgi:hypothetical protein